VKEKIAYYTYSNVYKNNDGKFKKKNTKQAYVKYVYLKFKKNRKMFKNYLFIEKIIKKKYILFILIFSNIREIIIYIYYYFIIILYLLFIFIIILLYHILFVT